LRVIWGKRNSLLLLLFCGRSGQNRGARAKRARRRRAAAIRLSWASERGLLLLFCGRSGRNLGLEEA
jgi:hypothetical protein